jgi:hypothetical protein
MIRLGQEEVLLFCISSLAPTTMLIQIEQQLMPPLRRKRKLANSGLLPSNPQYTTFAVHIPQTELTELTDTDTRVEQDPEERPIACGGPILLLIAASCGGAGLQ